MGLHGRLTALAAAILDPLLGLTTLERLYADLPHGDFIDRALERLGITVLVNDEELQHVPDRGAAIIVANHPTGAMDGLALAHAVMRRRRDVRLLGNHLLMRVPDMRDRVIAVNPFDPRSIENRRGLRAARAWLARGGLLIVFPAGEVSNTASSDGDLVDAPWQRGVLALAKWSGATIVPAFIDAHTSRWFRIAGWLHPYLRTALLPRELLRMRNRSSAIRFAPAIPGSTLDSMPGAAARLAYLRARSDMLRPPFAQHEIAKRPIAVEVAPHLLERDIASLDSSQELIRSGDYSVYLASAEQLPAVLPEIGRLRELSFRAVGEGTGRRRDLDRFDRDYQHLFVWHRTRRQIAGAYRIGATDRLCETRGVKALYSHTVFKLDPELLREGPMLELGRSFVRAEYQRESNTLLLLWKGIGAIVTRNPRYRRLFGPASISANYSMAARAVMAGYFARAECHTSGLARARRPFVADRWTRSLVDEASTIDAVNGQVKSVNRDVGIPVLVRQYSKLRARVLAMGVDPDFNGTLDALMLVDLTQVPEALLQRYLGRQGSTLFTR